MPTFIMLSSLTDEGANTITQNPERIKEVNAEVERLGVKVNTQYAVLGPYDFVSIVEAADVKTVMKVSASLASRGSIKIQTLAAIPIDEFIAGFK
ncbi:MAG: GYD domain-containing protein [Chloroflexi bacterium]|nr:GYD domain-containing protein [Chloroflexota bacterium]